MGSFLNFILTLGLIIIVAAALMLFLMYRKYGNTSGVIDARPPEQANRKIFKEGEGEYVDFTEAGGE